jgi:diadenosine tetraphosphate (Ap4A) HIT family hydrolase
LNFGTIDFVMNKKNNFSHLTAKKRAKISFPMNWLIRNNFLKGRILDYGCGFGTDVSYLKDDGYEIDGYDKYYFKEYPKNRYQTITCIYVLNVLKQIEQSKVLLNISELLSHGGKAFFVVRRDIIKEGFRIHKIYKEATYQTNVKLPFKSIFKNRYCEIYEYQHFNIINNNSKDCVFCSPQKNIINETALAYSIFDEFPVSKGHALIIPKRHVSNYFDMTMEEHIATNLILNRLKEIIDNQYKPDGYNLGVNVGKMSGQTINHVHVHLIPRYKGDIKNPIGGVRNVIPSKGNYLSL